MKFEICNHICLEGETLKAAIESGFPQIASYLKIGNAAGYQLHKVWCEYSAADCGVVLHIAACGSDVEVGYDPADDPVKEYSLVIPASITDCPDRIDFELSEQQPFDPFSDVVLTDPSACFGVLVAMIDEAGARHCTLTLPRGMTVSESVSDKLPTLKSTYPLKYVEHCRKVLARYRPKTDSETARIMERISELSGKLLDWPSNKFESEFIAQAKTRIYFKSKNRKTALAAIRMKAGMTQKQLAEAAQMSVRQLQNYEKCPGSTLFSASRYVHKRLAEALGVAVSDIIENGRAKLVGEDT